MKAYYSEFDPGAAEWLRELIKAGLIPQGEVDERDIREVQPSDLKGYTACHFFAGIGGWPHALRLAGWPGALSVWTGSCPCQPYSSAGKGKGDADERNLWPEFFRLIRECRPDVVFGEQVEAAIRHGWLDGISADLEGEGYAVGAAVLGAHSVGAPHIRQRLYWVADRQEQRRGQGHPVGRGSNRGVRAKGSRGGPADDSGVVELADTGCQSRERNRRGLPSPQAGERGAGQLDGNLPDGLGDGRTDGRMADARQQPSRDALAGSGLGGSPVALERRAETVGEPGRRGEPGGLGHANGIGEDPVGGVPRGPAVVGAGSVGGLGNSPDCGNANECSRDGSTGQHVIDELGANGGSGQRDRAARDSGTPAGNARAARLPDFWSDFALIPCRDGKTRRVPRRFESRVLWMADGLWYRMADVYAEFITQATQEVISYATRLRAGPEKVLLMVQKAIGAKAFQRSLAGPGSVLETEVLLAFVRDISSALDRGTDGSGGPETSQEADGFVLRDLRVLVAAECASLRREPEEQRGGKSTDVVLALSQFLARCCEACRRHEARSDAATFPLAGKLKGRFGLLRGYGNAICPQTAAAFIEAWREATKEGK